MAKWGQRTTSRTNASCPPSGCHVKNRLNRGAFTLIELLAILAILGVMVTLVAPMIAGGSDVSRVRSAARGTMQMSRYARTMAVLHQGAVELAFSENGRLNVSMEGGGGGESIVSAKAFATTNAIAEAEAARIAEFATEQGDDSGGGRGYRMADVNTEQNYEQVRFTFLGYTDTADAGRYSHLLSPSGSTGSPGDEEDEDGESVRAAHVRYKSNGTVRPYKIKVSAEGDNAFSLTVAVDMLGAARIEEDEK